MEHNEMEIAAESAEIKTTKIIQRGRTAIILGFAFYTVFTNNIVRVSALLLMLGLIAYRVFRQYHIRRMLGEASDTYVLSSGREHVFSLNHRLMIEWHGMENNNKRVQRSMHDITDVLSYADFHDFETSYDMLWMWWKQARIEIKHILFRDHYVFVFWYVSMGEDHRDMHYMRVAQLDLLMRTVHHITITTLEHRAMLFRNYLLLLSGDDNDDDSTIHVWNPRRRFLRIISLRDEDMYSSTSESLSLVLPQLRHAVSQLRTVASQSMRHALLSLNTRREYSCGSTSFLYPPHNKDNEIKDGDNTTNNNNINRLTTCSQHRKTYPYSYPQTVSFQVNDLKCTTDGRDQWDFKLNTYSKVGPYMNLRNSTPFALHTIVGVHDYFIPLNDWAFIGAAQVIYACRLVEKHATYSKGGKACIYAHILCWTRKTLEKSELKKSRQQQQQQQQQQHHRLRKAVSTTEDKKETNTSSEDESEQEDENNTQPPFERKKNIEIQKPLQKKKTKWSGMFMMPQLIADTYYTGNRDTAILSWRPFIPSFLPSSRYSAPTETFQDRKRQSTVYSEKISAYSDSNNTTSDHSGNPKRREKKESDAK